MIFLDVNSELLSLTFGPRPGKFLFWILAMDRLIRADIPEIDNWTDWFDQYLKLEKEAENLKKEKERKDKELKEKKA